MWISRRDLGLVISIMEKCAWGQKQEAGVRKRERERQFSISDDFALESPCFSSIEQDEQLMCITGFLSGYRKWQHPYFA